jgi:hypothetical protein
MQVAGQTTITYTPVNDLFPNPERGFYNHREVQAEGAGLTLSDLKGVRNNNRSLILRMYYLKKFRAADLSQAQLDLIANDFATMRTAGVKCVLRFAYSSSETDPDAPLSVVLRHLDQLKPLLEANSDVIAVMQAGFIGAWGEWYYSTNGLNTTQNRRTVLLKIMGVLPGNIMTQIRTPYYKKAIYNITDPLTPSQAYNGSDTARTAHHNDCFLASEDDYGTYLDTLVDKAYLSADTRFTPMGGETCNPSTFSVCPNALQELARMHWSFLNNDYNSSVLNNWIAVGCMDEIRRRLGYRFELVRGAYADSVRPGSALSVSITMWNRGWAAPYNPRAVELMLRNQVDSTVYVALLPEDPRFWLPGDTISVAATVGIPSTVPPGSYALFLNLPDTASSIRRRAEFSIRLANAGVWESTTGYNTLLHTVAVDDAASGDPYTGTLLFAPLNGPTEVRGDTPGLPGALALLGNYPNPFNASTRIVYHLSKRETVSLVVHDLLGHEVATLFRGSQDAGRHELLFDAGNLSSGIYVYTLRTGSTRLSGRMVVIK